MIAAVAVALAAVAQAASIQWSATKGYLYDGNGDTAAKVTSGSAYLMIMTADYTQSDLVDAYAAAKGDATATIAAMTASGALASGTGIIGSNARLAGTSEYTMSSDVNAYFVVFANDKMFVAGDETMAYDSVTQEAIGMFATSMTTPSKQTFDAADGFSAHGAGWYAVPEPTSGLLMLLGMGALALRRRRA